MTLLNCKRIWLLKRISKGWSKYLQDLKDFIKDIKHNFIPQLSTKEEDKEEKHDLFQSRLDKI